MPSAAEFSTTPDANTTIGGTNVAEGCSPGGINNVIRYLAAVARDTLDKIPAVGSFMPLSGGSFTGNVTRQGRGAFLHHANAAQTDGQIFFLPDGTARPTAAEGMVVFYY